MTIKKMMNRRDVLSTLFHIGLQLDQLHKSAARVPSAEEIYALSQEEYNALNATLNTYRVESRIVV